MISLSEAILSAARVLPEGGIISPKEFLHLGTRAAIDQALSRLAKEGYLLRIGRGSYTLPVAGRFGSRAPATENVLSAIEAKSGEVIVPSEAAAANALGLTTQVPVREVFITSGATRSIQLGARTIRLKHGARWLTALGNSRAGMAVCAVSWAGSERAREALLAVKGKLTISEWASIMSARSIFPGWLAKAIGEVSSV